MEPITQLKLIERDGGWAVICNGKTHQETNGVIVKSTVECSCSPKNIVSKENKMSKSNQTEAIVRLLEMVKPGDTVQTILRHVSRSGMSRAISPIINGQDVSYLVARACDYRLNKKHGGLTVGGCGMDMGFDVVYRLSHILFKEGFNCIGEKCPANDHSNGDREYTVHHHKDGGYALRQRWL